MLIPCASVVFLAVFGEAFGVPVMPDVVSALAGWCARRFVLGSRKLPSGNERHQGRQGCVSRPEVQPQILGNSMIQVLFIC